MIDDKPVIVTDKQKIKEIKEALKTSKCTFTIESAEKDKLPENAKEIWFNKIKHKRRNNYARVVK